MSWHLLTSDTTKTSHCWWQGKEHFRLEKSFYRGLGARRRGKAAAPQLAASPRSLRRRRPPPRPPRHPHRAIAARQWLRHSAQVPRDERPSPCAHGNDGLGQRRLDASPRARHRERRSVRRGAGSFGNGEPRLGRRTEAPRGSVLPREGKTRRRHPSGWPRWRCT